MRYIIALIVALVILSIYTYAFAAEDKPWEYSLHPKVYCEQRVTFPYDEWPRAKIVTMCFTTYPETAQEKKEEATNARRRSKHHR